MTPTPILSALLRSWVPVGEVKPWARAARTAGYQLSASALQAQVTGERRPTPETFLAVGKAQARPAAEVSMAVAMACGDEHAVEAWRTVAAGDAVAVLRAMGNVLAARKLETIDQALLLTRIEWFARGWCVQQGLDPERWGTYCGIPWPKALMDERARVEERIARSVVGGGA